MSPIIAPLTPAPWHIGQPGGPSGPFWSLHNPQGNVVAMQVTSLANARLISAAPDLYAALLSVVTAIWETEYPGGHIYVSITEALRAKAALDKADGRSR